MMDVAVSPYEELMASYEAADGYPADAWIARFDALPRTAMSPTEADHFLLDRLPAIAKTISCMQVIISDAKDEVWGKPLKRIEYITGGWSGAEDLIGVMLKQLWIQQRHTMWKRGGYFVFEVPTA